jgi:hypothetical protein
MARSATYTATFVAEPGANGLRSFRRLLKFAGRQLGLRCINAQELPSGAGAVRGRRRPKVRRHGEMNMPSAGKFLGKVFLKLADVKVNGPLRLFTTDATEGQYGKLDLAFDDHTVLSLNTTNVRMMARTYGDDYDEWGGKEVELVVGETTFEGEPKETIVLKPISPPIEKKPPAPKPKGSGKGGDMDDEIPFERRPR